MDSAWEDASKRGDLRIIRNLVEQGMDVNARDGFGQTALMLAAHHGHDAVVETLIAHGADLNVTAKYGLSALMLAVVAGHAQVARRLAKAGADLSLRGTGAPGFNDKTAHDLASARGMREVSEELALKLVPK